MKCVIILMYSREHEKTRKKHEKHEISRKRNKKI